MADKNQARRNNYFIKGLQEEPMKTYAEVINPGVDDRIKYLYEANADTTDGQECIKSVFVYIGSSSKPLYSIELKGTWDGAWDTAAEAVAQGLGYTILPD